MNGGAVTAFLPNFVGFPSLRGLHSSTVQPRRTPERAKNTRERDVAWSGDDVRNVRAPAGRYVSRRALPPRSGYGFPLPEFRSSGVLKFRSSGVPESRSSAAPCQLPPPHPPPPPPQEDPPPQDDDPPPQEELEPHDVLLPE